MDHHATGSWDECLAAVELGLSAMLHRIVHEVLADIYIVVLLFLWDIKGFLKKQNYVSHRGQLYLP